MKILFLVTSWIKAQKRQTRALISLVNDAMVFYLVLILTFWINQSNDEIFSIDFNFLYIRLLVIGMFIYIKTAHYKGLMKYVGSKAIYKLLYRNLILVISLFAIDRIFNISNLPLSFWSLLCLNLTFFIGGLRFLLRDIIFDIEKESVKDKTNIAIYGAGSAGTMLFSYLIKNINYNIVCFLDDNPSLIGREINNIRIFSRFDLDLLKPKVDKILLAIPSLTRDNRRGLVSYLSKYKLPILDIPSMEDITSGRFRIDQIKEIQIEDLLGRESHIKDIEIYSSNIENSAVCITGAGGSIGSELCRRILKFKPKKVILFELSEQNLYEIHSELIEFCDRNINLIPILGNAADFNYVLEIFNKYKVEIVFHAAAFKHVPLVEMNPISGIFNNVFSTKVIADVALKLNLKTIILVSTDKAVRPSNVMGASKRLAEQIIQSYAKNKSLKNNSKTIFSIVRFGNVIGSSGSVIPLFKRQISSGGPITVTDPEITRYFMTISEAAQLVIQASSLAKGGEVFLLEMGKPVKIIDLARQMIDLSGKFEKNSSNHNDGIEIVFTGLRPGEKLHEELLISNSSERTKHPLIFKEKESFIEKKNLIKSLNKLKKYMDDQELQKVLQTLNELVPEWTQKKN